MQPMLIRSRAPTRIDLAGGTVDLWPLYLFLKKPVTLNVAIDLFAEAELRTHAGQDVILQSIDQSTESRHSWQELLSDSDASRIAPGLQLHFKLLRYFVKWRAEAGYPLPGHGVTISTQAKSPAGAGLGGSSTLSVALVGAMANWAKWGHTDSLGSTGSIDPVRDGVQLVEIVRDVETTVIRVPAGVQDYYGAMFGGLQSLHWNAGSHRREWLSDSALTGIEKRLLLFYSGQSRNSGINNWALFKGFVDGDADVRSKFERISEAATKLDSALRVQDWALSGEAIAEEWRVRRTLAPGISTPEIDRAFERANAGGKAIAGKVCGAGGGGCVFAFIPSADDEEKRRVVQAFEAEGMRALPFQVRSRGLEVQVSSGA